MPDRDLAQARKTGVLRFLVQYNEAQALPRGLSPAGQEVGRAWKLADHLELKPRFVIADDPAALITGLETGRGDVLLTPVEPGTGPSWLATSTPIKSVNETVVVATSAKSPHNLQDLKRFKVALRPGSRAAATLARLDPKHTITIVPVDPAADDEELLVRVGSGVLEATVVDDDALTAYTAYQQDVKAAFTLRDKVQLA